MSVRFPIRSNRKSVATLLAMVAVFLVIGVLSVDYAVGAGATSPAGVTVVPLAPVGHFQEIDEHAKTGKWKARIKTKGVSDLQINEVTIQLGGTLGWHYHPGPSLVIVKSGTATFYMGDDPTCTPHVIPTGGTLFEPANMVHIVRNEGTVPLVNDVVQLIPTGAPRLISVPSPGNCPF
jgi:quercetin dioxygenase-like cupin family protein